MTNFMIAYFGGKQPTTKDEGKAHMENHRLQEKRYHRILYGTRPR